MQHFSLAIIGSGSGNAVVPEDPAQGPVAVIEAGAFGGTCINRGCIPSKMLVYTAAPASPGRTNWSSTAPTRSAGSPPTGSCWRPEPRPWSRG